MSESGGKTILVVGAYSGIGSAFARLALEEGYRLVLMGRRQEELDALASSLGSASTHAADISSIEGFKAELADAASRHGPFAGVFHAAGAELIKSVRAVKDQDFDNVFSGSFKGAAAIVAAAAKKSFLVDGGSVVLMSSVSSRRPPNGMALYAASKAAIDALVKSAALELAGRGVRVNSIVSGTVRTRMLEKTIQVMPEAAAAALENSHPLGFGQPEDVAHGALYLLSDKARWITGSGLVIDGGFLAK